MTAKQIAAVEGVKRGLPISKAMLLAGYAPSTAYQGRKKNMQEIIQKAQESYLSKFVELAEREIPAEKSVKRLKRVIESEDDFNAINAIKVVNGVMIKSSEKHQHITMNGVFVVPSVSNENDWQSKVGAYKQTVVNKSKALDAETIDDGKR